MEAVARQPIAARNLVFGTSNFFVLPVPSPWELVRGPFQPEVDTWTRRENVSWVTEGRAAYLLYDPGTKRGIELHIDVRRRGGAADAPAPGPAGALRDSVVIGGHQAVCSVVTLRRGLWPRRTLHRVRVAFTCEPLARAITLDLIGAYGQDLLHALARDLGSIQCH
ncbi:MAG: hypothetical protein HY726_07755 [Candidatus Rokubacteria bacterium]|nr:hypothetical protein [Candidatus Rokubacteria bacterium]